MAALAPGATLPSSQVMTSATRSQVPWSGTMVIGPRPGGSESVTTTSDATEGPALATSMLQAIGAPAVTCAGPFFVRVMSASGVTVDVTRAVAGGVSGGAGVDVDAAAVFVSEVAAAGSTWTGIRTVAT